jgi:hypothetical protein
LNPLEKGEREMDVRDYCDNLVSELTGWKAKMYDVIRRLEKVPSGDKEKVLPYVNDLNMVFEELTNRIARLRHECPTEWDPDKIELEGALGQIRSKWDDLWARLPKSASAYEVE